MRFPVVLLLLVACGTRAPQPGRPPGGTGAQAPADTTQPVARAGALVTRALAEAGPLSGRWRPQAGVCAQPPSLQLLAQSDSVDFLLLLYLPPDSAAAGTYVAEATTRAAPQARTARLGVQQVRYANLAYEATSGTVRLERLDHLATGRFDVTLQEAPSHRTMRYLGVFDAIPVDSLGGPACQFAAPDSARQAILHKPA